MPLSPTKSHSQQSTQPLYGQRGGRQEWMQEADRGLAHGLQSRRAQTDALGMYQDMAEGRTPSLAQAQLQQASDQNIAQQVAMAGQGRGGNLAGMQRQAASAGAAGGMQTQQQMAQLRAQEQQAAMAGLGGLASQQRGQDMQSQLAFNQMLADQFSQQLGADVQWDLGDRQLKEQEAARQQQARMQWAQMGVQAAGAAMGPFSDREVKTGIEAGGLAAREAVRALDPYSYEYEPGFGREGRQIGVMAQDLERSPAGRQLVADTPEGKRVDPGGMASLALAATSDQEERIRELEEMLRRAR